MNSLTLTVALVVILASVCHSLDSNSTSNDTVAAQQSTTVTTTLLVASAASGSSATSSSATASQSSSTVAAITTTTAKLVNSTAKPSSAYMNKLSTSLLFLIPSAGYLLRI